MRGTLGQMNERQSVWKWNEGVWRETVPVAATAGQGSSPPRPEPSPAADVTDGEPVRNDATSWSFGTGNPELGIEFWRGGKQSQPWLRAFGLPQVGPQLASEVFARHGNLIARYDETADRPLEVMVQFQPWLPPASPESASTGFPCCLECILSMQTSLLDAAPLDQVLFWLPDGRFVDLPARDSDGGLAPAFAATVSAENRFCLVTADGTTIWLTVHPGDLRWLSTTRTEAGTRVEVRLKTARMEKGVIRRARIWIAVAPSPQDEAVAAAPVREAVQGALRAWSNQFEESALPLST